MEQATLDQRESHAISDFLKDHAVYLARLRETGTAEVFTVDGDAAVVVQDAESYQHLMDRLHHLEMVASMRAEMARAKLNPSSPAERITDEERNRRTRILDELTAEAERLGLYQ